MKDSPAIIVASGLAGVLGGFFPIAQGWVLDQTVLVLGTEISAQSLGFLAVSRLLFLPSLVVTILGVTAMVKKHLANRVIGSLASLASIGTLGAWFLQKATIQQMSLLGVTPSLGLFLLLVSGIGGLTGGLMLVFRPQG